MPAFIYLFWFPVILASLLMLLVYTRPKNLLFRNAMWRTLNCPRFVCLPFLNYIEVLFKLLQEQKCPLPTFRAPLIFPGTPKYICTAWYAAHFVWNQFPCSPVRPSNTYGWRWVSHLNRARIGSATAWAEDCLAFKSQVTPQALRTTCGRVRRSSPREAGLWCLAQTCLGFCLSELTPSGFVFAASRLRCFMSHALAVQTRAAAP